MKMKRLLAAAAASVMAMSALTTTAFADWSEADGKQVYINENGKRVAGFQNIDGNTFYFDKNGYLKTGWVTFSDGRKYYFSEDDGMRTGWISFTDGKKYYLGDDGVMTTGWKVIGKETYYFNKDGSMKTGWLDGPGDTKYFLDSDGTLARNVALKINGVTYDFDKDGKASARKTSGTPSGTSSADISGVKLPEFSIPTFGNKKSSVLKECGLGSSAIDLGDGVYGGFVNYGGIESSLLLTFNDDGRLCSYALSVPMSYTAYSTVIVPQWKESFGYDYDYDDGVYTWIKYPLGMSVQYNFGSESYFNTVMNFTYVD